MRIKSTYLLLLFILLSSTQMLNAQDLYRTIASGNWASTLVWEYSTDGGVIWDPALVAPGTSSGTITIRNGHTVTVAATVSADEVVVASGGILTVSAAFTIADGTGTDLNVQSGGTLNIGAAFIYSGTVANAGTVNWSAGTITSNAGTFNNSSSFLISGNNDLSNGTGTNTFNNLSGATITKSAGVGNSSLNVNLSNAGTINVNAGTLRNNVSATSFTNSGNINITGGNTFAILNTVPVTINTGTTVTGTGLYRINGPSAVNMALSLPSTIEFESGGEITGSGSITVNGILTWIANAIRVPVTIASGATLDIEGSTNRTFGAAFVNNGTINWTVDADLVMSSGSSITNNTTFNYVSAGDNEMRQSSGTPSFTNNGTFLKTGTATTLTIRDMASTSTGIIQGVGTIAVIGGSFSGANGTLTPGTSAGILTIAPSAVGSGTDFNIEILSAGGAGVGHDQLVFTGGTDLNGTILNVTENNGAPVGIYTIMTTSSGSFSNSFATVNKPANYGAPVIAGNTVTIEKLFVLPVNWGEFYLKSAGKKTILTWETHQESNASHFVIERSTDGKNYTSIGNVQAQGNSSITVSYTFTDGSPAANATNFYRLKQVDFDGTFDYSPTRVLRTAGEETSYITVYGNPVSDNVLRIGVMADDIHVMLSDMTGKVVKSMRLRPGVHNIFLNDVGSGTYTLSVLQKGAPVSSQKIVKY